MLRVDLNKQGLGLNILKGLVAGLVFAAVMAQAGEPPLPALPGFHPDPSICRAGDWYYLVTDEDYTYHGRHVEGFVVVGANNYMVKVKLAYYNFWKFMRALSQEVIRKGYADKRRLSALTNGLSNTYYGWIKSLRENTPPEEIQKDIITLRDLFFASEEGKAFAANGL